MKLIFQKPLTVIMITIMALCSCNKKDTAKPDTKTLLTAKTWTVSKVGYDNNENNIIDDTEIQTVPSGVIFATVTFSADGSGMQFSGSTSVPFTWQLKDEGTIIMKLPDTYYFHIKVLSAHNFNFNQFDSDDTTIVAYFECVPK